MTGSRTAGQGQGHEHRTSADTVDAVAVAEAWLAEDPDPDTRAELQAILAAGDTAGLGDRFGSRLEFGTAGLRGELGAGPNRMNRVVVIQAAAGLASYVRAHGGTSVVIGYDARHKSDVFARDTAEVMAGAGLRAVVLPRPLPTPVLAFAIRHLGADAGVMVTASHNPPQDNGYKVYLGDGSQIVPPADAEISAEIDAVGPLAGVPRSDDWETLGEEVLAAYIDRVAGLVDAQSPRDLSVVYTPLHGVGRDVVLTAFDRAGFPAPTVVSRQGDPDPEFSTVAFPNPEEPGAIDLALAAAVEHDVDLVLANDPDADRCAVAVRDTEAPAGWRMLRGDEVGALLAAHLVRRDPQLSGTFAASIVSSSLLGRIAAAHGLGYVETLTGFKWISRVEGLRYGYEEALGYCVDPAGVRDKDGVSAALLVAELAATLKSDGPHPDRPARRPGPRARPARHRPALGAGRGRRADRGRDDPPARAAADVAGRPGRRARRGPRGRVRRPAADRRAALPAGRRRPGGRAALRDRAQAQGVPGGGGAGGRRRRHRCPAYGGRGARRDQGRPRVGARPGLIRVSPGPRRRPSAPECRPDDAAAPPRSARPRRCAPTARRSHPAWR